MNKNKQWIRDQVIVCGSSSGFDEDNDSIKWRKELYEQMERNLGQKICRKVKV